MCRMLNDDRMEGSGYSDGHVDPMMTRMAIVAILNGIGKRRSHLKIPVRAFWNLHWKIHWKCGITHTFISKFIWTRSFEYDDFMKGTFKRWQRFESCHSRIFFRFIMVSSFPNHWSIALEHSGTFWNALKCPIMRNYTWKVPVFLMFGVSLMMKMLEVFE